MAPALLGTRGPKSSSPAMLVLQFGAIILIFYFLLIRPQAQARKKHAQILAQLKRGDDITTAGGIIGKVKDVKDDRITIESGTATLVVERGRLVRAGEAVSPTAQHGDSRPPPARLPGAAATRRGSARGRRRDPAVHRGSLRDHGDRQRGGAGRQPGRGGPARRGGGGRAGAPGDDQSRHSERRGPLAGRGRLRLGAGRFWGGGGGGGG